MDNKVLSWWKELTDEERDVLIEMLFYMDGQDFRQFGVVIGRDGLYHRKKSIEL